MKTIYELRQTLTPSTLSAHVSVMYFKILSPFLIDSSNCDRKYQKITQKTFCPLQNELNFKYLHNQMEEFFS